MKLDPRNAMSVCVLTLAVTLCVRWVSPPAGAGQPAARQLRALIQQLR